MRWRILDDQGEIVVEGEGGELVAELEAGLPDAGDGLILEWRSLAHEVEIPMELAPLDRVDAQMLADLFDADVEHLPMQR